MAECSKVLGLPTPLQEGGFGEKFCSLCCESECGMGGFNAAITKLLHPLVLVAAAATVVVVTNMPSCLIRSGAEATSLGPVCS